MATVPISFSGWGDSVELRKHRAELDAQYRTMSKIIGELRIDTEYTDLVLECDGQTWSVHKAIVCRQSSVLAMLVRRMNKDASDNILHHEGHNSAAIDCMIQFFYTQTYKDTATDDETTGDQQHWETDAPLPVASGRLTNERLLTHVTVASLADYYDIAPLKKLAHERFEDVLLTSEVSGRAFIPVLEAICENPENNKPFFRILTDHLHRFLPKLMIDDSFKAAVYTTPSIQPLMAEPLQQYADRALILDTLLSKKTNHELLMAGGEHLTTVQRDLLRILNAREVRCTYCWQLQDSWGDSGARVRKMTVSDEDQFKLVTDDERGYWSVICVGCGLSVLAAHVPSENERSDDERSDDERSDDA